MNSFGDSDGGIGIGQYGAFDYQTRVSRYLEWIDGVLGDPADGTDDSADGTDDTADGTDDTAGSSDGADDSADGTDDSADGADDSADGTDDSATDPGQNDESGCSIGGRTENGGSWLSFALLALCAGVRRARVRLRAGMA